MDWSWLALLACPLMMIPMMFMMMKGGHGEHKEQKGSNVTEELNELRKQNDLMLQELQHLKEQKG